MKVFFTSDTHFGHKNIMKYCRRTKFMTEEEVALLEAADLGKISQRDVAISSASVNRMNQAMIDNINDVVGEDDVLYHLGDVFYGCNFDFAKRIRDKIKCRTIHHILGNHDEPIFMSLFSSSSQYAEVVVDKQRIFLCHYPMRSWNKSHDGAWSLYGHVHGRSWEEDKYGLSSYDRANLNKKFKEVISSCPEDCIESLVQIVADYNCNMLTLDVGVDTHDYRPWSMEELRKELSPKFDKRKLRREQELESRSGSSRK